MELGRGKREERGLRRGRGGGGGEQKKSKREKEKRIVFGMRHI